MDLSLLLLREDIGDGYDAVVRAAAAAVGAEVCHLVLYDRQSQELVSRRARLAPGAEHPPRYRFAIETSPASALVVRTASPHVSNDPANDPLYDPSVAEGGLRSIMTVPVLRDDQVVGLVYALNKPGGFAAEDARALMASAGCVGVALENLRLWAEERDRRVFNESLLEVTRALIATPTEDAALGVALDQLWRILRYQAAAALVAEGDTLRVAAVRGADEVKSLTGQTAPELFELLNSRKAGIVERTDSLRGLGFRSRPGMAVVAPLVSKRELLGGLVAAFEEHHGKDDRETQLVAAFADQVALFLDTSRNLRRERQARGRAAAVARVTRMVATRVAADSNLRVAAAELLTLSGADRCILYLGHARNPVLIPVANAGTLPDEEARVRELRVDLTATPINRMTEEREPLLFQGDDPLPVEVVAYPDTRTLLFLPMVSRDVIMGAVALYCVGRAKPFDPVQVEFLHDVTQQIALGLENARLFAAMSTMATTDELTRIANRRKFMDVFQLELQKANKTGRPLTLILADVDHLKKINDGYGHPAGDAAIRHVADVLREGRREADLAARLGGEEFGVILPDTDILAGARIADQICSKLGSSVVTGVGTVTASFGVATAPEDGDEAKDLMKTADERLYTAKSSGRDQVCYVTVSKDVPESTATRLPRVELPGDEEDGAGA
jgi:diguanylate cyclase (GGDEF)-like protein